MSSKNESVKKKGLKEFDIRDVGYFLLKKSWIIAIAAFVCLAFAILYTALIPAKYVTTTRTFLIAGNGDNLSSSAWAVGEDIVEDTPHLVDGNEFCRPVADILNGTNTEYTLEKLFLENDSIEKKINAYLKEKGRPAIGEATIKDLFNEGKAIEVDQVVGWLSAEIIGKDLNTFTITAETSDPALSYLVSNVATWYYRIYVCESMINSDADITYTINDTGSVPSTPSNKNFAKNAVIAAVAGAIVAAIVLIIVFIFDDRIKTPDDIQKHLGLNILGTIPDFENKRGAKK